MNDGKHWWIVTVFWQGEDVKHPLPKEYLRKSKLEYVQVSILALVSQAPNAKEIDASFPEGASKIYHLK